MGYSDVSRLTELLTGLNLAQDQRLEYQQFFNPPWCHSDGFEKEHRALLTKVSRCLPAYLCKVPIRVPRYCIQH